MKVLIIRLMAWLLDFAVSIVFFNYLLSFDVFIGIRDEIIQNFLGLSFSATSSNILSNICLIYLLTTSFRFYSCLLFGRSISQLCIGIKNKDGFLWSRIGGGLRTFIEILFPLTLLDAALLLRGQKTLKESISGTTLIYRGGLPSKIVTTLYSFIVIFLTIGSPLLQNMTFVDGVELAFSKIKLEKIDNRTDFSKFKHYPSETFKLSSFSAMKDGNLTLIPSFEITREKNKKRIRPYLVIYDLDRKVQGDLRLQRRFSLFKVIQIASKYDPLFSVFYPELQKVIKRPLDHYGIKKYEDSFGDKKLLNPIAREEIQKLIQSSFELSFNNLIQSVAKIGPFISGHIKIRNLLLSLVDSTTPPTVDMIKLGNYNFLRLKQIFDATADGDRSYRESYIPIETLNSSIITMEWGSSVKDALAREEFKSKFLGASKWFFDYSSVFKFTGDEDNMSAFSILDYFSDLTIDQVSREKLEKYTFTYFSELSTKSMISNDEALQNSLIASMNRLVLLNNYAKVKAKDKGAFSNKFSRLMSNLKEALKNKNKKFFEVK